MKFEEGSFYIICRLRDSRYLERIQLHYTKYMYKGDEKFAHINDGEYVEMYLSNEDQELLAETKEKALVNGYKNFINDCEGDLMVIEEEIAKVKTSINRSNDQFGHLREKFPEEFI